jgi:pantetheine-phosphate adenylyltransferase
MKAIYPGSFDPLTFGHLDIIKRMSKMYDQVVVAILINKDKKSLFSLEEREKMLINEIKLNKLDNVEIKTFDGLLVNFAKEIGSKIIVRGLRTVTDYEYELTIAQFNSSLYQGLETVFLLSDPRYSFISSSGVREVAQFKGDVSAFVPESVRIEVEKKIQEKK